MQDYITKQGAHILPETWATEEELTRYVCARLEGTPATLVSDTVWHVELTQGEKNIYQYQTNFPMDNFLNKFLLNPKRTQFAVPLMIKAGHFSGLLVKKTKKAALSYIYFNPTSKPNATSAEDMLVLKNLYELMRDTLPQAAAAKSKENKSMDPWLRNLKSLSFQSFKQNYVSNQSQHQQINSSDCAYIVGKTLVELCLGEPLSIKSYETLGADASARAITTARIDFCKHMLKPDNYIRQQLFLRLAKALVENQEYAKEVRGHIKHEAKEMGGSTNQQQLLKGLVDIVRRIELNKWSVKANTTTEAVCLELHNSVYFKDIDNLELRSFIDGLLEPHFLKHGDVIFKLHRKLAPQHLAYTQHTF